ncbi:hypothetical protein Tco_1015697 [Tanacetum coccineum]|uniref:MAK10-like protein n=1 Tax=Tanacetum coccineum TaxID=301880 RepID=A0ABQ5FLL3_9ASTR
MHIVRGDGVTGIKRCRRNLYGDGIRNLATASRRGRLKEDLESSTWRRYTKIDINYASGGNLGRLSAKEAWETIEDCVQYDKQWKNLTSTIFDQTITNLKARLVENEMVRVMIPKCMSWLDAFDEPIGDMEDKEDNPSPQSASRVLLSIELYTPPVTYPKEVDETIGIPIEVEPLDQTKLEDLGLNTFNHDIPLSSRGIPSVDEPEP